MGPFLSCYVCHNVEGPEDVSRQDPVDEEILVAVDLAGNSALMVGTQPWPVCSGHPFCGSAIWQLVQYRADKWKG